MSKCKMVKLGGKMINCTSGVQADATPRVVNGISFPEITLIW